jgi:hypothetical protein
MSAFDAKRTSINDQVELLNRWSAELSFQKTKVAAPNTPRSLILKQSHKALPPTILTQRT